MEGQTKAAIEGMARLEGQIQAAEVQLKTLETFATQRNPDVIRLQESIEEMRRQLRRMGYGSGERRTEDREKKTAGRRQQADSSVETRVPAPESRPEGGGGGDFAMSLGMIPGTGLEMARLVREAKMQETIFTLLMQQLEQAKIAEAKDTPTVRILDRAVPAEGKARPLIGQNVAIAGILSLFFGVGLAFVLENVRKGRMTPEGVRREALSEREP
jgi:capsule polysaccharide export protein KpsE/RkpR